MGPGIFSLAWFVLSLALREVGADSVARPSGFVHQGRSLTFPYGSDESYLEFTFGVGLPMNLPSPYQVSMSLEMRADYKYPVNASDLTNPTKRREDKEKEEEMEKEKERTKAKESDAGQQHSIDVTQTRANSGDAKVEENIENSNDTFNSTECPNWIDEDISKFKFTMNEDESNTTIGDLPKSGCYDKEFDKSKLLGPGKKKNKLHKKKKEVHFEKSVLSEFKGVDVNITNRPEYVEFIGEDSVKKTHKIVKDGDINHEDGGDKEGGAKVIRKRDAGGRSTRWRIYHVLEMAAYNLGMDGRACLLRSICEAAATPLHHRSNELVGELLHVLFTPSTTDDDRGRHLDNEYRAAEHLGSDVGNSCELLYPECDFSFLDLITTFDLF